MIDHEITLDAQVPLPDAITEKALLSLVTHVLAAESIDDPWQVGIQFVDDNNMQAAHLEFMDIDEPTDIMTFPYADDEDVWGDSTAGGDLMISVDRARDHATEANWSEEEELFFLVIHGILHLSGWDDHTPDDRAAMLARQDELLQSWRNHS